MKKGILLCVLFAAAFSLYIPASANAAEYPAIGPLPERKAPDPKKAELGKALFFDARVSGDAALSCASCHNSEQGWTTRMPLSDAYPGSKHWRNASTLLNIVYKGKAYGSDGRLDDLDDMLRDMITDSMNMNMDMQIMQERFKQDEKIVALTHDAYKETGWGKGGMGTSQRGEMTHYVARNAIVQFLETLVSKNVPFDKGNLSDNAKKGMELFKGKAGCIQCHNGPYFSDVRPHNTGVPENPEVFKDPQRHFTYVAYMMFMGVDNRMNWRRDVGYYTISKDKKDVGKFITPTLRELKYTAPYMHNGMFATLDDVIEFYNMGGGEDRPGMKDAAMKPLNLSGDEKMALKEFLLSLSGDPITIPMPKGVKIEYKPIPNWKGVKN
ncbi:MAG: photosynthetic protein synthase I [Deltaproteobacteria bacterium]|nr:photosynthetic protein synthase I [Deltaproteobacteria bacterium]